MRKMQRFHGSRHHPNAITVRTAPRDRRQGIVSFGGITVRAALGRSGTSAFKREGDGATPVAAMPVLYGFVRGERVRLPPTALPIRRIRKDMLWCDQPEHPAYNRLVRAPFRPSHEEMMRADGLYDICIVLDWNIRSRRRHGGSAIFFHLIKPGYQPTAGCIAVSLRDMLQLIRFLRAGMVFKIR
ncbi:L,D-transpeptidase [Rhizobium puerariae]|uniref:L,D-transpeptidase n=1 Tax=Rhizobium puerariae TaxID=1585791 RepID=A0ABV6AGR4_9HYPH